MDDDMEKYASLAATFLESEYGSHLMQKLTALHFGLHEQAEKADDSELPKLMARATQIREITDLITAEAGMVEVFAKQKKELQETLATADIAP